MKALCPSQWRLRLTPGLFGLLVLAPWMMAAAQVVPSTPTKFDTRKLGEVISGGGASVGITPPPAPPPPVVKQVTYFAIGDARQWTSNDGKPLLAKLIAFEEATVVITGGMPNMDASKIAMPPAPTVVRNGKVRLLVNGKPFEVPLNRLSESDQKYVGAVQDGFAKK